MELAALWRRGSGLVPGRSLFRESRESGLLSGRIAEPRSARRVQERGHSLLGHPRERRARPAPVHRLGRAGEPIDWPTHVRRQGDNRRMKTTQAAKMKAASSADTDSPACQLIDARIKEL